MLVIDSDNNNSVNNSVNNSTITRVDYSVNTINNEQKDDSDESDNDNAHIRSPYNNTIEVKVFRDNNHFSKRKKYLYA